MGRHFLSIIAIFLIIIGTLQLSADERDENIDVYLVLDKSLSMEEEIGAVKEYVADSIIDELLIPGDNLIVISFYGKAESLLTIKVTEDKSGILKKISEIQADERFTDIGNALDALRISVDKRGTEGRREYLLLITDGIQEAPQTSKYYSPDGTFNHEFLENTKEIVMQGWKIHVLGIGTDTAAEEIAEELSGTFSEVPENPTVQDLENQTKEFLGVVEVQEPIVLAPVGKDGATKVRFSVLSAGYSMERAVVIKGIRLTIDGGEINEILDNSFTFSILPEEEKKIEIPAVLDNSPEPGTYQGRIVFIFAGDTPFVPAADDVSVRIKSFLQRNVWIFPVAAVVLALLVFAFILIMKLTKGGSIKFWGEIEDGLSRKRQFKLKIGKKLFITDGVMGLTIVPAKNEETLAELTAEKGALRFTVLDERKLKVADLPANVLGKEIFAEKRAGKKVRLSFKE